MHINQTVLKNMPRYFTLQTGLRLIFTGAILYESYKETGPWTLAILAGLAFSLEGISYTYRLLITGYLALFQKESSDTIEK